MVRSIALLLLCLLARPAYAQSYMPLEPGTRWIYGRPPYDPGDTYRDTLMVVGPTLFAGKAVVEVDHIGPPFGGLRTYWGVDPDGTVLQYGSEWQDPHDTMIFEPPIRRFVPGPAGSSWTDSLHAYRESGCLVFASQWHAALTSVGVMKTCPAGTFPTDILDVQHDVIYSDGCASDPSAAARAFSPAIFEVEGWVPGIGCVHWNDMDLLQFDSPVPARRASWSALKERYR